MEVGFASDDFPDFKDDFLGSKILGFRGSKKRTLFATNFNILGVDGDPVDPTQYLRLWPMRDDICVLLLMVQKSG